MLAVFFITISHCPWRDFISWSFAPHVRLVVASPDFTFNAKLGGGKRMEDEALHRGIQRVGDASNDAAFKPGCDRNVRRHGRDDGDAAHVAAPGAKHT